MYGVAELAPCTATELEKHMNTKYNMKGTWKVLSFLKDLDVVYEVGTRNCSITGRNVIEWDLTDRLPVKVAKKQSKPRNLNKSIDYLLKGMELRGWDSISKEVLINLKDNGTKTKKKT